MNAVQLIGFVVFLLGILVTVLMQWWGIVLVIMGLIGTLISVIWDRIKKLGEGDLK